MPLTIRYIPAESDPITPGIVRALENDSRVGDVMCNSRNGYSYISYFAPDGYWSALDDDDRGRSGSMIVCRIASPVRSVTGDGLIRVEEKFWWLVTTPYGNGKTVGFMLFKPHTILEAVSIGSEIYLVIRARDTVRECDMFLDDSIVFEVDKDPVPDIADEPDPEPVPEIKFCPYCGQPSEQGWKFCSYCGRKLVSDSSEDSDPDMVTCDIRGCFVGSLPELEKRYDLNDPASSDPYMYLESDAAHDIFIFGNILEGNLNYHGTDRSSTQYEYPVSIDKFADLLGEKFPVTADSLRAYGYRRERAVSVCGEVISLLPGGYIPERPVFFSEDTTVLSAKDPDGRTYEVRFLHCGRNEYERQKRRSSDVQLLDRPRIMKYIVSPDGTDSCMVTVSRVYAVPEETV